MLDDLRQTGGAEDLIGRIEMRVQRTRRRRRTLLRGTMAAAAIAVAALWAVPWVRDTGSLATPAAQRQSLALADGSTAELNAHTAVKTDFRYGRRRVRLLQGEAFFSVAKDQAHPFDVETPAGTVRVTGTQFNVRLTPGGGAEVTLVEGSVVVTDQRSTINAERSSEVSLAPGQQWVSATTAVPAVRTLDASALASVVAWRRGEIVLEGITLAEAAARFAQFHGCIIDVAPEVAGVRLGGSCPLDDVTRFLNALTTTQALTVIALGDGSHRIVGR